MSNPAEQIKALQYIFDVTRTAPAPAAVHEQVQTYARYLADSFNPTPNENAKPATAQEARDEILAKVLEAKRKADAKRATDATTPAAPGAQVDAGGAAAPEVK